MSVNIYFASDNKGSVLTSTVDYGYLANGDTTDPETVWIFHDGENPITDCGFYLTTYSPSYTGWATAVSDQGEILAWGDALTEETFGGFQINMNASGSYADWASFAANPNGASYTFNTAASMGKNLANAIPLAAASKASGGGIAGTIEANAPDGFGLDYQFQTRIIVPQSLRVAGIRQFDLAFAYTYTS
jgi:hypothetical protein